MLNDEAREELGDWEQDSADILQTMFLTMCEGSMLFPAIRGAAIPPPVYRSEARRVAEGHTGNQDNRRVRLVRRGPGVARRGHADELNAGTVHELLRRGSPP
jgi:hypothetical protein